jgi:hypothetical protein
VLQQTATAFRAGALSVALRPSERELRLACSVEARASDLLTLAVRCPDEVLANPVLALLSLSDPEAWVQIVARARGERDERAIKAAVLSAPASAARRFAAECLCKVISVWKQTRPSSAVDAIQLASLCEARARDGASAAESRAGKALAGRIGDQGRRRGDGLAQKLGQACYPLFEEATRERIEGAARAAAEVAAQIAELAGVTNEERARLRAEERAAQLALLERLIASTPGNIELETSKGGQLPFRF